jgi:hypothetical protein
MALISHSLQCYRHIINKWTSLERHQVSLEGHQIVLVEVEGGSLQMVDLSFDTFYRTHDEGTEVQSDSTSEEET